MGRNKEEPLFNRIEQARTARGLTRQQLADAVGVHYQTIGYLERGEYSPSLTLALRLAVTGVDHRDPSPQLHQRIRGGIARDPDTGHEHMDRGPLRLAMTQSIDHGCHQARTHSA